MKYSSILLTALTMYSCSGSANRNQQELVKSEKIISKVDYGNDWPFTVEKGVLKCSSNQVLFLVNGKQYAINGTAQSLAKSLGYSALEEIWAYDSAMRQQLLSRGFSKDDVEEMTTRVGIGRIIQDGLSLCD